jgi:hypothetical protein
VDSGSASSNNARTINISPTQAEYYPSDDEGNFNHEQDDE